KDPALERRFQPVVVGEPTRVGPLVVTLRACRKRPQEDIPETAAFFEINEQRPGEGGATRLFTGWMFASSPAVSGLEHPVYDIWLTDCKGPDQTIVSAQPDPPKPAAPLTYYHELDPTLYTVTSNSFVGQVYALFGLTSIADGVEEGNDYPQLNAEFLINANPDLIILADANWSGESPETVAARDGWADVAAVKNGSVIVIDDDIASRWGPRLVDFVKAVAAALQTVPAA
ncbi:MAG TPA: DUF2155 domain-containing protein, partial [Ilumatobacteraceae bacterium]|nr:DUF2155 domain-containing protein [Ilumatobacteraceae bacterium]